MSFKVGDRVLVKKKEERIDDQETYLKVTGVITEAFNAWDEDGDHWQYRIRGRKGEYVSFYDDVDEGEIILLEKTHFKN